MQSSTLNTKSAARGLIAPVNFYKQDAESAKVRDNQDGFNY